MHKNNDNFIEYNIIISFLNKKRYRKRKKLRYIVHLILYMDIKILNVHLEFNSTLLKNIAKLCQIILQNYELYDIMQTMKA